MKVLRTFDKYGVYSERKPGMYTVIIIVLSQSLHRQSAFWFLMGKRDVDMLGFETEDTFEERQDCRTL
ncbi:hypothetical protein MAR_036287 [Mya arenaria]|uniref:Uncharacterized protein n=1 Tax=Mya arenaria TaxID=6604 RepID=A0ABY7ER54_MYAAR|nr:hypothetical protein MAR_036287 [Mya arenaria]